MSETLFDIIYGTVLTEGDREMLLGKRLNILGKGSLVRGAVTGAPRRKKCPALTFCGNHRLNVIRAMRSIRYIKD